MGGDNKICIVPGISCGVVFQLVPSGSGWTENVIYAFTGNAWDGWSPSGLIQDSQGNLYGVSVCTAEFLGEGCAKYGYMFAGAIFRLSRSGGGWAFEEIHAWTDSECPSRGGLQIYGDVFYSALAFDAAGNLYATEGGESAGECGDNCYFTIYCGGILRLDSQMMVTGYANIFGNMTSDAKGNLYGTTRTCGFGTEQQTRGMIWEYSPEPAASSPR